MKERKMVVESLIFGIFLIFNSLIILIWQCSKSSQPTPGNNKRGGKKERFNSTKSGTSPARTISSVQTKISSQEGRNKKGGGILTTTTTTITKKLEPSTNVQSTPMKEQPTQTMKSNKHPTPTPAAAAGNNKNKNDKKKGGDVKVITVTKNSKPSKNSKNVSRRSDNKSLLLQSTQFSMLSGKQEKLKKTQSDDDIHERHGTPEPATDKTQKSFSHRLADDEGTNSNIEELPMDKHKSE